MRRFLSRSLRLAAVLAAVALTPIACNERSTDPATLELRTAGTAAAIGDVTSPAALLASPLLWDDAVWACKAGSNANITAQVDAEAPAAWSLTDGTCTQVSLNLGEVGSVDSVTVTEFANAAYALDSINVKVTRFQAIQSDVTLTGTNSAWAFTTVPPLPETGKGAIITFYNHPLVQPPTGRLGDYVWSDANDDGVQDAGESGIGGATVSLLQGGSTIAVMNTDANGNYLFTGLLAGCYTVMVGTPVGMAPTSSGVGDPATDSNGSPANVCLPTNSSEDLTIDFGFVTPSLNCQDQSATNYGMPLPCQYITPCPAGTFTFTMITPSGDLFIRYDQFPAPNDNSYGVNAVGWGSHGHTFGNLTGSDHAGFQLRDAGGVVRLSFNVDYLSAVTTAPSGYASLGVLGGDGRMNVGTAPGISATTSLANNLNNINIPGLFNAAHVQQFGSVNVLVNSPPTDAAHLTYVGSDPLLAGWDFHNTYFVTISAAKLASLGFDANTWAVEPNADQLHNSPAKVCPPSLGGGGAGGITLTKVEFKDKEVKLTILNSTANDIFISDLVINWPTTNGKLMQVKLEGDIVYDKPDIAGGTAHLTTANLVADQNKRKIPHGKAEVLKFVFERRADTNLTNYLSTVSFGTTLLALLPH